MKRKNILPFIFAILLAPMLLLFTACGGKKDNNGNQEEKHTHSFSCKVANDDYLETNATCIAKAKYYYSCTCGEKGTETFEFGEPLGHTGGVDTCNSPAACSRCGEIYGKALEHTGGTASCKELAICSRCGETYGDYAEHIGEWYVTAKPRCFDDGSEQRICTVCDKIENRTLPAIGHHELEKATCVAGKKCKNCHYVEGVGTGHVFPTEWTMTTEPTCTETGIEKRNCLICGEGEERTVSALGHVNDWTTTVEATCLSNGSETNICKTCKQNMGTRVIPATGHQGEWETTTEPTCTNQGEAQRICTKCGEKETKKINGSHNYSEWEVTKSPECYSGTYGEKVRKCLNCNKVEKLPIMPMHDYYDDSSWVVSKNATCTTDGEKYRVCKVCSYKDYATIKKLGHQGEWVITQGPTCVADGVQEQVCTICQQETSAVVPKLGHNMMPATCTTPSTCSRCGCIEGTASHDYSKIEPKIIEDPDCERDGYKILTCSKCGDEKKEYIDKLNHDFGGKNRGEGGWEQRVAPTCINDGKDRRTCLICKKAFDSTIEKLGHNLQDGDCTKPYHCTRCDYQEFRGHQYGENGCTECGMAYTDVTYELSSDGTYYIVKAVNDISARNIFIRETYNSKPVKILNCSIPSDAENVILSNNIESICENAFISCSNLTTITLGNGLKNIGTNAFYNCLKLKNIYIVDLENLFNVEFENSYSSPFAYNPLLYVKGVLVTEIVVPNTVTKINDNIFYGWENLSKITFGDKVKNIGNSAFYNCKGLTNVIIPNSVTNIGDYAFYGCENLKNVEIGNSVTNIGDYAFYGCENLKNVEIGNGVTSVGECSFFECSSLTSITIPSSMKSIGDEAFYCCYRLVEVYNLSNLSVEKDSRDNGCLGYYAKDIYTSLKVSSKLKMINGVVYYIDELAKIAVAPENINAASIILDDDCTGINQYAFYNCANLVDIIIPSGIASIDKEAFSGCDNLNYNTYDNAKYLGNNDNLYLVLVKTVESFYESIRDCKISDKTKIIYSEAFSGCNHLTSIYYEGTLEQWCNIIFNDTPMIYASNFYIKNAKGEYEELTEIEIPNTITEIKDYAFYGFNNVTKVIIPNSVKSIGVSAFLGCRNLLNIEIPDSVNSIGDSAFYNCSSLENIKIPDNIINIGNYILKECNSLTSITMPFDDNTFLGYIFGASKYEETSKYIPDSLKEVIITKARVIAVGAFYNCSELTSIVLPSTVTNIGDYAFYNCSSLTSITLSNNVSDIGIYAFYGCGELTDFVIPEKLTNIGEFTFYNCSGLTSVIIPSGVKNIGISAFANCKNLTNVTIENGVNAIGSSAFYGCSKLTSVTIPNSVMSLGYSAFEGCNSLLEMTLPFVGESETENTFLGYIFGGNQFDKSSGIPKSLRKIVITNTKSIGDSAFSNCSNLTSIILPSTLISIGDYAFYNCSGLTSIILPNGVKSIGDSAFGKCTKLKSIFIPNSVETIKCDTSAKGYETSPFIDCDIFFKIYCEAKSQPQSWSKYWNYNWGTYDADWNVKTFDVVWDVTVEEYNKLVGGR